MDDDLEDEIFYQTLVTHMKLMSKLMMSMPLNSAAVTFFNRHMRFYLLKPETIACGLMVVVLLTFFNSLENWCKPFWFKIQLALGVKFRYPKFSAKDGLKLSITSDKSSWEFRQENAGVYAVQGRRPKMEDRFSVETIDSIKGGQMALYGVFDGHGGDFAAEYVEKNLFKSLVSKVKSGAPLSKSGGEAGDSKVEQDYAQLLSEEILSVDKQLLQIAKASKELAGTTALVAMVHGTKLIVANVGDSRGVICDSRGNASPLSFDHKPQQLKEQKRIKQAGGFVTFNGVWRVAGILATSRALGDYPLKDRNLIIADPDVLTFDINEMKPQFMILASDGLWDTFSNEEAVAYVKEKLSEPDYGAKSLVTQAYQRGSLDNITVIVVVFQNS